MASLFKYLRVLLFIVIFFMIGRVYANTSYYSSKNNCEYGEQPEIADCLRNELIESTIMLKEAENNIKQRIQKWSAEKSASLDEAIPVALYKLDESIKHSFVIASLSARLLNHGERSGKFYSYIFLHG